MLAVQPRLRLAEHQRERDHPRHLHIVPEHVHGQCNAAGHICRDLDGSELLRGRDRVLLHLWLRVQAWLRRRGQCSVPSKFTTKLTPTTTAVHHLDLEQQGLVDVERARHGARLAGGDPRAARHRRAHGLSFVFDEEQDCAMLTSRCFVRSTSS